MRSFIIGTAGHIDHGKTALVAALTGKDPDRLPEEKRRGITIDLGFADLDLGEVRIGFVDVPGHERFIKNMLAGAHGIDAVMLVIAADEGVMPQTREHFDICRLLGVETGLVVITKTDLVDEELAQLVRDEASELVEDSFLEGRPMVSVSAKTGFGLEELKKQLGEVVSSCPERPSKSVARLPVDRAFTIKGFGTVVTGTLISGAIHEGDEMELLPRNVRVRARTIQVHGQSVKVAHAGQRTAVNLVGIDIGNIERGMVLAPVGRFRSSQVLDVELKALPNAPRALRSRNRIRLHVHAAEILGRVRILNDNGSIEPGASAFAQLRLESPATVVSGDRFILRSYSPSQTIAGGLVLDPFATKHRGKDLARVRSRLESLRTDDEIALVETFVSVGGNEGQRRIDLAARTGWADNLLASTIKSATDSGSIIECDGVLIDSANFRQLCSVTIDAVNSHHQREPLSRGLSREVLRERLFAHVPAEIFRSVLSRLEEKGAIVSTKDVLHAPGHSLEVKGADAELKNKLAKMYEEFALEPPSLAEVFQRAGVVKSDLDRGRKVLQLLIDNGEIVRVQGELLFHRSALELLKTKLQRYAVEHEPDRTIDVAGFKDLAQISRKYAIPLLEYLDRQRVTRREGDRRSIVK